MATETIRYTAGGTEFASVLVHDEAAAGRPRPLLLVSPNWLGVTAEQVERARVMAGERYIALLVDMYGGGRRLGGPPEAAPLANALRADVAERRLRIGAALEALTREAARLGGDTTRRAAVGFCFGGGNVMELARSGADIQAAVCLHGDLTSPRPAGAGEIRAALLVLHGSADPVSPKAERDAFEAEMDAAGARWQMLTFGGLVHSFSEAEAAVPGIAEFNEPAARQSYRLLGQFIEDAFAGRV